MIARTAAGATGLLVALAAVTACHSTPSPSDAKGSGSAPSPDAAPATDPAAPQMATFSLFTPDTGKRRRFVAGLAVSRIDDDGGTTPMRLGAPTMSADAQEMTAGPVGPGHYRAHFLVAPCAPDSKADGCKPMGPKPDEVEFDVPASGSVEVTVR